MSGAAPGRIVPDSLTVSGATINNFAGTDTSIQDARNRISLPLAEVKIFRSAEISRGNFLSFFLSFEKRERAPGFKGAFI